MHRRGALAQQMAALTQKLQEQVEADAGSAISSRQKIKQLENQNQSLAAKNDKQARQLDMRHPFRAMSLTHPSQELDIYLDADTIGENNRPNPPIHPTKQTAADFLRWLCLKTVAGLWPHSLANSRHAGPHTLQALREGSPAGPQVEFSRDHYSKKPGV